MVAGYFLNWFKKNQLKKLAQIYDLVPYLEIEDLAPDQKIVLESAKNHGEVFDFLNKEVIFESIDSLINLWHNKSEFMRFLEKIYYSIW